MRTQINRAASAMGALTLAGILFTVTSVSGSQFSVKAKLVLSDASTLDVADATGKVRSFKSVDDFISAATKAGVINGNTDVPYSFENVVALEPKPYTGDLTKKAVTDLASIAKQITAADAEVTNLTAQIALFPVNMTTGEAAQKAERTNQKDTVAALKTWLVSEQTRINAILHP